LLDTHVWLWWQTNDLRLGPNARALIAQTDDVRLSAASAWEIAIKTSIGKLKLPANADIGRELERDGFRQLPVSIAHADAVRRLPLLHRDPFDRLLIAQALTEGLTILTSDEAIATYNVAVLDARE
jgi:PIN domain nuclease of toxin-antitoxin system